MAKTIFIEIVGNASQFKKELTGAVASTNKANSGFHRMGRAAGIAGLALAGGLAVGLAKAAKGALEDQVAHERLTTAFKNAHVPIDQFSKKVAGAEEAGRKLGFQDEQVTESLGSLITATHDGTKAIQLNATAMDIARFKHVGLAEASKMLTSTMAGNVRSAKALGIILLPVTSNVDALRAKYKELGDEIPKAELRSAKFADKQATAAQAIEKVNAAVHGQATAFGETAAGKLEIFNARMDELRDNLGAAVLPALVAVTEKLSVFAGWLSKHETLTRALVIALGALAAALLTVSVASAIATAAMSPFLLPIAAAVVAIGVLSFVVYKLVSDFRKNWPLLLPIVMGPLGAIIAAVIHWHSQITGAFTAAWNTIKSVTTAGINAVLGAIRGAVGAAVAAAQAVGTGIVNGLRAGLAAIVGAVTGAFGKVWAFLKGLVGVAAAVGASIGAAVVSGFISGLSSLASRAAGIVRDAISHLPHISIPGHSPIEDVGFHIGQLISSGMVRGLKDGSPKLHQELVNGVQDAKAGADNWIDTTGVANMTEKGTELAHALAGGFAGAHEALIGAIQNAKDLQLTGAALVNAPARPMSGPGGLTGSALVNAPPIVLNATLNLDGDVIYRNQKRYAAYDMNRNGGTGIRA